jgi:hypothetical protein
MKMNNGQKVVEVTDERTMRRGILNEAMKINCEHEVQALFDKFDKILFGCTNQIEREHITRVALEELNQLFIWHKTLYDNQMQPFFTKPQ